MSAAKAAIDRYGTSVSASRPVSGERPVHRDLEHALARVHGTEDCVVLVGGHSTNVTVIGHLLGRNDVIVHDALIHNSIVQGAMLSGARRVPFPHLDHEAADRLLREARPRGGHALLVIEGHYSMDGDVPDLPAFIAVARRNRAWLMVDEAHALGVLGPRGFGTADRFGVDPGEVDIWMGTLSKSLVSCGGYIAGSKELIDYLESWWRPGFVFSVGMAPPAAAAALAALELLEREPERVRRLNDRAALFLRLAREGGLDVGGSIGASIVPIVTGSSIRAGRLAQALFRPRGQRPADPLPGGAGASRPAALFRDGLAHRGADQRYRRDIVGRKSPRGVGAERFGGGRAAPRETEFVLAIAAASPQPEIVNAEQFGGVGPGVDRTKAGARRQGAEFLHRIFV